MHWQQTAELLENTVGNPHSEKPEETADKQNAGKPEKLRIGVAKDAAFCFLYEDNLEYLRAHGCEPVFFSPLTDKGFPDGIFVPQACCFTVLLH